jgi:hypothetical protein
MFVACTFNHLMEILSHMMVEGRQHIKFHHIYLFNKGWWKLTSLFGFVLQGGRWEAPKSTRCRGHVWGPTKFYFLRDSAQKELQRFPATQHSLLLSLIHYNLFFLLISTTMLPSFPTNTHQSLVLHLFTQFYFSIELSMHVVECNTYE